MLTGQSSLEKLSSLYAKQWNQLASQQIADLAEFEAIEREYGQRSESFELNYSSEIDLPSFRIDANNSDHSVIEQTTPRASENQEVDDELEDLDQIQSRLVKKLFPQATSHRDNIQTEDSELVQSLRAKLAEIELEHSKSKQTCAKIKRERDDLERKYKLLQEDRNKQSELQTQEVSRIQQEYDSAMKKLKRERQIWEKQRKLAELLPTKRERKEVELLQSKLNEQLNQSKEREHRMQLTQERLSRKVADLEKRNRELSDEIKVFEQERVSHLELKKKYQALIEEKPLRKSASLDRLKTRASLSNVTVSLVSPKEKPFAKKAVKNNTDYTTEPSNIPRQTREVVNEKESSRAKADLDKLEERLGLSGSYKSTTYEDGRCERIYPDDSRHLWYPNGNLRVKRLDDVDVTYYTNGDSKTIYPDQSILYWYNETRTRHLTNPDGFQLIEFDSGQVEKRFPCGKNVIQFPDKTLKTQHPDGSEEIIFSDGKYQETDSTGRKTIVHCDGTREVWADGIKSKMYVTGIIKRVFPDGTQETRWPNGQIRVKDKMGTILKFVESNDSIQI